MRFESLGFQRNILILTVGNIETTYARDIIVLSKAEEKKSVSIENKNDTNPQVIRLCEGKCFFLEELTYCISL